MKTPLDRPINRRKQPIPKCLLLAGLSGLMGSGVCAETYAWTGATSTDLNDVTNWVVQASDPPVPCPDIGFNNHYNIALAGANVTQSADVYLGDLVVACASGAAPVFNMTHKVASNWGTIAAGASAEFNNATGTINHTAGEATEIYAPGGPWILVGCWFNHGNSGTYNFGGAAPGPLITIVGTSTGIAIGGGTSNTGVMSLSNYGTINSESPIFIGTRDCWSDSNGNGTLNITGGNLSINVAALYAGGHMAGDPAAVVAGNSSAALHATIDATGISAIHATTVRIDSLATFSVDLGSGVTPTLGEVFTIIDSTNPITGSFADLAEGDYLSAGSYWFKASYLDNKFTLTTSSAPPPPPPWVEEGFGYTVDETIVGKNGGAGFAAGWSALVGNGPTAQETTIATGLTYPGLASAGAGALLAHDWCGNTRTLSTARGSGTYYMSMLINANSTETSRFGCGLITPNNDNIQFGRVNGGWGMFAGGNGTFGISNSGGNWHQWQGVAAAADSNTHLIVYKFDYLAKTIVMWVDPTLGAGEPTPDATLQTGTVDPGGTGSPADPGTWTIELGSTFVGINCFHEAAGQLADELRIGRTWETVLPSSGVTTAYASWASGFSLDPLTTGAADADPDQDGISNGIEFVTGSNPSESSTANLPTASVVGTDLVFVYRLADAALSLNPVVQTSATLANGSWTDVTAGIVVENGGYGTGVARVTVTIPRGSAPHLFSRLKVEVP